jgi:hypothetical protein
VIKTKYLSIILNTINLETMSDNAARRIQETITLKTVSNGDK